MALHVNLMVNGQRIGYLAIQRRDPGRPSGDDVCHYDWQINLNGHTSANLDDEPLAHRYGDGAWVLVARAIDDAGYLPAGTEVPGD